MIGPWSRGRTLIAGAVLIVLTNAVALGGAWWNREGEPESRLVLSERELMLPFSGYRREENSGLQLRLAWRVAEGGGAEFHPVAYASGGSPDWLDAAKMRELGFTPPAEGAAAGGDERRRYVRQQPREALLVLEFAGPAWTAAVEAARENARRHEAAAAANADSKEFIQRAKGAQDALRREETMNSRLFAVDAGADLAALRAKYPDRGRYMIVRGTVRPNVAYREKQMRISGYLADIGAKNINVPFALRPVIERLPATGMRIPGTAESQPRYEATLALGRRLEPWIVALKPLPAAR